MLNNFNFPNKKVMIFWLICFSSFFVSNNIHFSTANPFIPPDRFRNTQIGLLNPVVETISHVQADVQIDVYDKMLSGSGTYLLRNSGNQSINHTIGFSSGGEYFSAFDIPILSIKSNGTQIPFTLVSDLSAWLDAFLGCSFNLTFGPLEDIELKVQWKSLSRVHYTPIKAQIIHKYRDIYFASYQINGGNHWNNTPIETEQVVFRFHSDEIFRKKNQVAVNTTSQPLNLSEYYNADYNWGMGESFSFWQSMVDNAPLIPVTTEGDEYSEVVFNYSNISEDICLNIVNYNTGIQLSEMGFALTTIIGPIGLLGLIITITSYLIIKKKRVKKPIERKKYIYKSILTIFALGVIIGVVGQIIALTNPPYYEGNSIWEIL